MLWIPAAPAVLHLPLARLWNGGPCDDARLHGHVALSARPQGLRVSGGLPDPTPARVPDTPPGQRIADLWHHDVVECFLVGRGGRYLEVELGAGGHFLVLSFTAPRVRSDAHEDFAPRVDHTSGPEGWHTALELPWAWIPEAPSALNAFAAARGLHLAFAPVPGAAPDFHQPQAFPAAALAPEAARLHRAAGR